MKVSTILRQKGTSVETISREVPLREAVARLAAKRIGALVVLGEERCAVGVLAESDIVRALAARGAPSLGDAVHTAVARPLVACAPNDSIELAMSRMTQERTRHLPVLAGDALVGIVSLGDLVKHQLESLRVEVGVLRDFARMRR